MEEADADMAAILSHAAILSWLFMQHGYKGKRTASFYGIMRKIVFYIYSIFCC